MKNFYTWLLTENKKNTLLKEDLSFFDKITPEKYMQMLLANEKGKEFVDFFRNKAGKPSPSIGLTIIKKLLDDPLSLYFKATRAINIDPQKETEYQKIMDTIILPFTEDKKTEKLLNIEHEMDFTHLMLNSDNPSLQKIIPNELKNSPRSIRSKFLQSKEEGGFYSSDKKIYFQYDASSQNGVLATKKLINYFTDNNQFFRQAKFPKDLSRAESFVFYTSIIGEMQIPKIQGDINGILNNLGLKSITKTKYDTGGGSGNEIEVTKLNLATMFPLAISNSPPVLQKIGEFFQKNILSKNWLKTFSWGDKTKHQFYIVYRIIQEDPNLKQLFTKNNIDIDSPSDPNPNPNPNPNPKPKLTGKEKLTLILQGTNRKIPIELQNITLGKTILYDTENSKFISEKQFMLNKQNGIYTIQHHQEAKNITKLNGTPCINPTPLNNRDIVSIGNSGKEILKISLI